MENELTINKSSKEQGFIRTLKVCINPTESDYSCDCCGKPISELGPISLQWNREKGAFDAKYLFQTRRRMMPYIEEVEKICAEFHGLGETEEDSLKAENKMIEKYGKEEAEKIICSFAAARQVDKSWECRDCFGLNEKEYFERYFERYKNEELK
jgi:hypothetical protein